MQHHWLLWALKERPSWRCLLPPRISSLIENLWSQRWEAGRIQTAALGSYPEILQKLTSSITLMLKCKYLKIAYILI